jgi:hypothetical protein
MRAMGLWLRVGLLVSWQTADKVVAAYGFYRVEKLYLSSHYYQAEPVGRIPFHHPVELSRSAIGAWMLRVGQPFAGDP